MTINTNWSVTLLLLISVLGVVVLFDFPARNGFIQSLDVQVAALGPRDPPASTPLARILRTPLQTIQRILDILVIIFTPATTGGESPGFLLHFVYFFGQGVAMWTMTTVEGMRRGNQRYAGQL